MRPDTDPEASFRQLAGYALPALFIAMLSFPFYVLVPEFYAGQMGLPIAAVGFALLMVRIIDALTDPLAGILADRTSLAFGRRRIWVLCAAPFVALTAWFVLSPPQGVGIAYLFVWATALSLAWTAISVPYQAWGAELSRSYAGRTRVAAFREAMTVTGTLLALIVPFAVQADGASQASGLWALAWLIALGLPAAVLVTMALTPEPAQRTAAPQNLRDGWPALKANRPFRLLLSAFFVNSLANGLPATLFLFFVADRLGAREQAGPLLVLYFICGIAGVPFWLWLSRRTSKHRAWALGMLMACLAFAVAPFLGQGQVLAFALVTVFTGLALGADVVLPAAVQGDVIDVDTATSGQERAGLYLGLWAFATKLAFAGAVGLAFPLLAAAGYDPGKGLRSDGGLAMLAFLYAGLPILLKLGAVAIVWRFPLDQATLADIRRQIEAR